MYLSNQNSFYDGCLLDMTGRTYIAPDYVGLLSQKDRFVCFLKSGEHAPLTDGEQLMQIPIKRHTMHATLEVPSAEGQTFKTTTTFSFKFNPAEASRRCQADAVMLALSRDADEKIEAIILREARYGLEKAVGRYQTEELLYRETQTRLEREVQQHVQTVLADFGITVQPFIEDCYQ
jgi:hypothetical protein